MPRKGGKTTTQGELLNRVQEVIPMRKKAYHGVCVKDVDVDSLASRRPGEAAAVGFDVAKKELLVVIRWPDGRFERPWRGQNPGEIGMAVEKLKGVAVGGGGGVALEGSGGYGVALRGQLRRAGRGGVGVSCEACQE